MTLTFGVKSLKIAASRLYQTKANTEVVQFQPASPQDLDASWCFASMF
ncbi:hypothetical protein PQG02_26180 [Nostoc sp. UHCC 0926]|nr:hypothetical protein [Nostoc sp. UHCC 0926]WDD35915.1 hypothetical protein PQG02_26180 [Nostoc sp. UHCC 0926]